jgi:hypothetical protein
MHFATISCVTNAKDLLISHLLHVIEAQNSAINDISQPEPKQFQPNILRHKHPLKLAREPYLFQNSLVKP